MKYRFAECELDVPRHELRMAGAERPIEPQVFRLLAYLVEHRQRVVSKDELIDTVWEGRIVSDAAIASRISAARSAVGDDGHAQAVIRTLPRLGFRFVAEVEVAGEGGGVNAPALSTAASAEDDEPAVSVPPAVPLPDKPKLAVLPFSDISEGQDQAYLADGIAEDIIFALSKYRWLLVLARNATVAFRSRDLAARELAGEIGADYLVTGSVRRDGGRIRINVQLTEGSSGAHIWADRYDREVSGVFELQDEITATIAARIGPELETAEQHRVRRKPPSSLDSWDHYLLGLEQFYKFDPAANARCQALFERAIELDPEFAQAYARLSYAIVLSMVYFDHAPDEALLRRALDLARQALAIDEQDAVAHFALGRAYIAQGDFDMAVQELHTSADLNPCLAVTYCGLGDALTYAGRLDEAVHQFEQAIRLSPHDPYRWGFYSYRALAHIFRGEYEAAASWAQQATQVPNAQYWANAHLVAALGYLNRPEQTQAAIEALLQRKPEFTCEFARQHLFYIKNAAQMDRYIEGLRRAGIPEARKGALPVHGRSPGRSIQDAP